MMLRFRRRVFFLSSFFGGLAGFVSHCTLDTILSWRQRSAWECGSLGMGWRGIGV